jgi:hypothetical protein
VDGDPLPGFLDATVISNYANELDQNSRLLTRITSRRTPVSDEIEQGANFGHLA